jgi:hypothetical protein
MTKVVHQQDEGDQDKKRGTGSELLDQFIGSLAENSELTEDVANAIRQLYSEGLLTGQDLLSRLEQERSESGHDEDTQAPP